MATIAMTFYAALLFGIALSYVLLTFVALFSWLNGTFSLPSGLLIVPIVLLVVVGAIRGTRRIKRQLAGDLSLNDHQEVSWWRATLIIPPIVAALLATAVFAFTLVSAANHHAKRAKDGRATNYTVFGTQLTSWGAEAARLSWTTDNVDSALRPLARTCVMYLGQTGGNVIVYVPFAGGPRGSRVPVGTFRIPAGSVAVRVLPQGRCVRKTPYPVLRPT